MVPTPVLPSAIPDPNVPIRLGPTWPHLELGSQPIGFLMLAFPMVEPVRDRVLQRPWDGHHGTISPGATTHCILRKEHGISLPSHPSCRFRFHPDNCALLAGRDSVVRSASIDWVLRTCVDCISAH